MKWIAILFPGLAMLGLIGLLGVRRPTPSGSG